MVVLDDPQRIRVVGIDGGAVNWDGGVPLPKKVGRVHDVESSVPVVGGAGISWAVSSLLRSARGWVDLHRDTKGGKVSTERRDY
jgi:hypothetical protein